MLQFLPFEHCIKSEDEYRAVGGHVCLRISNIALAAGGGTGLSYLDVHHSARLSLITTVPIAHRGNK